MKTYAYINPNQSNGLTYQLNKMLPYNCDEFFIEEKRETQYKELEHLLEIAKSGDRIIITDINVLGVTLRELSELMTDFFSSGVLLISVDDKLESSETLPFEKALSMFVEIETRQGIYESRKRRMKAKESGKEWGRPVISEDKVHEIRFLYQHNKLTMREVANECNVSLGTVHKYLTKNEVLPD